MPHNLVDAVLPEEDRTAIMTAIADIRGRLPFLVDLSPKQRKKLFKLGPARLQFTRNALTVAQQNDGILQRSFDLSAFERDVELAEQLDAILIAVSSLHEHIDDTRRLVGTEALHSARHVYKLVKAAPPGEALDEAAKLLGKAFAGQGRKKGRGSGGGDGGHPNGGDAM